MKEPSVRTLPLASRTLMVCAPMERAWLDSSVQIQDAMVVPVARQEPSVRGMKRGVVNTSVPMFTGAPSSCHFQVSCWLTSLEVIDEVSLAVTVTGFKPKADEQLKLDGVNVIPPDVEPPFVNVDLKFM